MTLIHVSLNYNHYSKSIITIITSSNYNHYNHLQVNNHYNPFYKKCQLIGLREELQETPLFHGKIYGFPAATARGHDRGLARVDRLFDGQLGQRMAPEPGSRAPGKMLKRFDNV